jgi:hypothetical protein
VPYTCPKRRPTTVNSGHLRSLNWLPSPVRDTFAIGFPSSKCTAGSAVRLNVSHHGRLDTFRSLNTSGQYGTTTDNERLQLRKTQVIIVIHEQPLLGPENPWIWGRRSLGRKSSTSHRRSQRRLTASLCDGASTTVDTTAVTSKATKTREREEQGRALVSPPSRGHAGRTELVDRFLEAQVSTGDADRERAMVRTDLAVPKRCHGSGRLDTRVTKPRRD